MKKYLKRQRNLVWLVLACQALLVNQIAAQPGSKSVKSVQKNLIAIVTQRSTDSLAFKRFRTENNPLFDSPHQPPISYIATGGIGLRWTQHYFDNPLDMDFIDGQYHLEESRERRLNNIRKQTVSELLSEEKIGEQYSQFKAETSPTVYLQHIYYNKRWDTHDVGTHGIATAQNGFLPGSNQDPGTCTAQTDPEEVDLSKEVIRSNRVRMGLAQIGTKEDQQVLRQSSLMSLAFGWLPSVELPVEQIEKNENEQIIEAFYQKMAKTHQIENFKHFQKLMSRWKNAAERPDYWNSFYTQDKTMHPVSKLSGILEGVQAIDINKLTKNSDAYIFFNDKVSVQPNFINFNQISILQPEQMRFVIQNLQKKKEIVIENILSCSPEVIVYLPKNQYYPIYLQPGESVTLTVVVAPETWGMLQTALIVSFSNMMNLMVPITSFHVANEYELEPFYYTNVNVGEQVQGSIKIKNPSAELELDIVEVYSTEDYLKLYWPNSVLLVSQSEAESTRDFSRYLKIEAGAKAKVILKFRFETDQLVDHRAVIHLVTNRGDVLRIPLYFHIYPDLLKFTPSIVDFGIIPFKFDALRVPVHATIRNGFNIGMLYLSEVLLPINDKRLDFEIGKWDKDTYGNVQIFNKQSMRLEEHRRGVLHKDRQLDLFTVILNPQFYGEINTQIVLVFTTEEGKEFRVELPIIGHVLKQNNLLVADQTGHGKSEFEPWANFKPIITLNVRNYVNDLSIQQSSGQLLKKKQIEERLNLWNNLGAQIEGIEVINMFQEATFQYQGSDLSSKQTKLNKGQSIQLGTLMLNLKDFKTVSGRFYFFLQVNHNLFLPMAVQISDNSLVCSYMLYELMPTRFSDCQSGIFYDMRNMAINQPRFKYFNMTNLGSEPVMLDWLTTTGDNEVFITFKSLHPAQIKGAPEFPLGLFRGASVDYQKRKLAAYLQPQQTVIVEIGVEAQSHSAVNVVSKKLITIQLDPPSYGQVKIEVTFNAQKGSASFLPKYPKITFNPTYLGASTLQTQSITFSSTLSKIVHIKEIKLNNPQFKLITVNTKLKNGLEVLRIQFDPNDKEPVHGIAIAIKNSSDHSLIIQRVTNQENPPINNAQKASQNQIGKFTPISLADITSYRQTQEQLFADRKKSDSQLVTGTLTIETDQLSIVEFELEGEIKQPNIFPHSTIDFGKVQIGSSIAQSIVIINPFGEPLQFQLSIGRQSSEIETELRRLKLVASAAQSHKRVSDQDVNTDANLVFERIISKLNYTRFHCGAKIKQKEKNEPKISQNQEWLEFEEPLSLTRHSDKDASCSKIANMIYSYKSIDQFKTDQWLWSQIEEYCRQIIIITANFEGNANMDNFSRDQLENLGLYQRLETLIEQLVESTDMSLIDDWNPQHPIDQTILDDLTWCTAQKPFLDVNQTQWLHLTQKVAFSNAIDHYFPVRPFLYEAIQVITAPFRWVVNLTGRILVEETWTKTFQMIFNESFEAIYEQYDRIVHFKRSSMILKPEDFLATRQKDKNFMPAATTTNSIEFRDESVHNELVKNNGTIGVERNIQSFFLNPKFNKMLTIPPYQNLTLQNAIIYEPHVLLNSNQQNMMTIYVKTDHTPIQTLNLVGSTSSSVLDMTKIIKVNGENNLNHIYTNVAMIPSLCREKGEKHIYPPHGPIPICKNKLEISEHVSQQIFGKSTLTSLITLRIDIRDAIGSEEKEEMLRIASNNFITRIRTFISQASAYILRTDFYTEDLVIASEYVWRLGFTNIGNEDFRPTKFGFEDPITGEISCKSGDLLIDPCFLEIIPAQDSQYIQVILKADYSTSVYKKTLVFECSSHTQRFPLTVTTDQRVLEFVSQFERTKYWSRDFIISMGCLLISVVLITYKQVVRIYEKPKPQTQQQETPEVIQLQSSVYTHYQQVQDRFRMHNNQFMREVTNLGKRSNSAFTDYQKNMTAIRKPPQVVVNRIRVRQQLHLSEEESKEIESDTHIEAGDELVEEIKAQIVTNLNYKPENNSTPVSMPQTLIVQQSNAPSQINMTQIISNEKPAPPASQMQQQVGPIISVVQQTKEPVPAFVYRMNKKERRAYEQRRKENELALATQIELQKILVINKQAQQNLEAQNNYNQQDSDNEDQLKKEISKQNDELCVPAESDKIKAESQNAIEPIKVQQNSQLYKIDQPQELRVQELQSESDQSLPVHPEETHEESDVQQVSIERDDMSNMIGRIVTDSQNNTPLNQMSERSHYSMDDAEQQHSLDLNAQPQHPELSSGHQSDSDEFSQNNKSVQQNYPQRITEPKNTQQKPNNQNNRDYSSEQSQKLKQSSKWERIQSSYNSLADQQKYKVLDTTAHQPYAKNKAQNFNNRSKEQFRYQPVSVPQEQPLSTSHSQNYDRRVVAAPTNKSSLNYAAINSTQQSSSLNWKQSAKEQTIPQRTVTELKQHEYFEKKIQQNQDLSRPRDYYVSKFSAHQYGQTDLPYSKQPSNYSYISNQKQPQFQNERLRHQQVEDDAWYEQEPVYHHQQVPTHAYHRNKRDWQPQLDHDEHEQEDEYEQEYNEDYDAEISHQQYSQPQYQHYQKRPYWQQQQEQQFVSNKVQNQYKYGTTTSLYQPTVSQPSNKSFEIKEKPQAYTQQKNTTYQNISSNYWKPKDPKHQQKTDSIIKSHQASQPTFANSDSYKSNLQKAAKIEQHQSDQAESPQLVENSSNVSNFYNAFKSIQSMFNQQKRVKVDQNSSQSRQNSPQERPSFNSLFFSEPGLFQGSRDKSKELVEQPKFSLFGDPIWNSQTNYDQPFLSDKTNNGRSTNFYQPYENKGPTQQLFSTQQEIERPLARELFKPVERSQQAEQILQFPPLRQYNTMFTDSLETLTSKKPHPGDKTFDQLQGNKQVIRQDANEETKDQTQQQRYRLF